MASNAEGGGIGVGVSNGGMLYHEVQESKLCAVHCVNTVLQGPFFSEFDLAALASDLDRTERQMMLGAVTGDFLPEQSHNVSLDGDFSIQVRFLKTSNLQISIFNELENNSDGLWEHHLQLGSSLCVCLCVFQVFSLN